jgi:hypothetical protein
MNRIIFTAFMCILSSTVSAGEAEVLDVKTIKHQDGTWQFDVTVSHADEGWEHYVNQWDIVGDDGTVYGKRVLYHPHVNEQPFTRSLSGVHIPEDVKQVSVRAHDSVHQYGGKMFEVKLPVLR